jgi:hypothetical protein
MTEPTDTPDGVREIHLANPVSEHFEAFIFGNALHCEQVAVQGSAAGQHIVICGAGPSLADHIAEVAPTADQLWGCNSALPWLLDHGYRATHGFAIDQTPAMLGEWATAPDVEYLVASTVHPHLTEYLRGKGRRLRFFHNYVGIKKPPVQREDGEVVAFEDWMYAGLYPSTVRAGSGLNAVTRAIDVALFLGAATITVLGADCALRVSRPLPPETVQGSAEHLDWLRDATVMHADGGSALASGATPLTLQGEIDGRMWHTKPDLMISAVSLVAMVRHSNGRVRLLGDTLPNALMDKDEEYLKRLPSMQTTDGAAIDIFGSHGKSMAARVVELAAATD